MGAVTYVKILLIVQVLESVEQHYANIGSGLTKSNTRSDHHNDEMDINMHLARLKADLKHKISQQDETSECTSQQFENSEVQQHTPPDPTASPCIGQKDERAGPQAGSVH